MPNPKYIKQTAGAYSEEMTINVSSGAPDALKVPCTDGTGILDLTIINGKTSSAGAGDANKVPALDGTGRLDSSFMPVGIVPEVVIVTASEALAAGDYVNFHVSSGNKVRKADASNGRRAHGVVLAGVANGAPATVYLEGVNTQLSSRTFGATQFLSGTTPGAATETAPTTSGHLLQIIGYATSATSASIEFGIPITLA